VALNKRRFFTSRSKGSCSLIPDELHVLASQSAAANWWHCPPHLWMKSATASETNKIILARSCLLLPLLIKKRMYRKCFWMQCKWRQLQGASEPKVLLPSTSIGFRKRECSAGCSQHCRTRCLEIQCLTWARTHLKVLERAQSVVSARGDPSWTSVSFFFSNPSGGARGFWRIPLPVRTERVLAWFGWCRGY
jgi:hypothetical protein